MGKEQRRRCYRRSAETELRVMPGVDGTGRAHAVVFGLARPRRRAGGLRLHANRYRK